MTIRVNPHASHPLRRIPPRRHRLRPELYRRGNALPRGDGYGPMPALSAYSAALPAGKYGGALVVLP
jgi:hypothetical protein